MKICPMCGHKSEAGLLLLVMPFSEYNVEECRSYKLLSCYENLPVSGQEGTASSTSLETESDFEDTEDPGEDQADQHEDHYVLLVKAWEQKVFPTIRRRFRNEAERKDGLEQIRGALQLGEILCTGYLFGLTSLC